LLRKFLDGLYLFAGFAAGGFLVLIFALMMILSLGREVAFNIPAGDDFASWCMAAMSFLGLAHTFRAGDMIRVGLLLERLHGRAKWFAELLALSIGTIAVLYFTYYIGRMTHDSWRFHDMSTGVIAVPLWIPQFGCLAGLAILSIALIDEVIHVARGFTPRYEKEKPTSPEELVDRIAAGGGA
jgi:TRAP-type C4-dicarboxylate transport system permease small subunit